MYGIRELAVVLPSALIVCGARFFAGYVASKSDGFPLHHNSCSPRFSQSRIVIDSLCPGRVGREHSSVTAVLRSGRYAEIAVAIIKGLTGFDMVSLAWITLFQPKDFAMHVYSLPANSIKTFGWFIPASAPIPLIKKLVAVSGDNRVESFCQGNKLDRLIGRLNNRFASNAILGHDLTSNEIAAVQPHFYSTSIFEVCS